MATNFKTPVPEFGTYVGSLKDENGLLLIAHGTGAPSGGGGLVQIGCLAINQTNGAMYFNTGTVATPVWSLNAAVSAGSVLLAYLSAGITPSHVVKYAGTTTWTGGGATKALTVTGVAATDIVMATVRVKATEASYLVSAIPSLNTITFELSAANTSNDAQISYEVLRAAV